MADITYLLDSYGMGLRLQRKDMPGVALEARINYVRLAYMDAGSACEQYCRDFNKSLAKARLPEMQLRELAYVAAVVRDYYNGAIKRPEESKWNVGEIEVDHE